MRASRSALGSIAVCLTLAAAFGATPGAGVRTISPPLFFVVSLDGRISGAEILYVPPTTPLGNRISTRAPVGRPVSTSAVSTPGPSEGLYINCSQ